jgi:RNA polymerase sigma-70 factor (ECF subfamily)
VNREQHVLRAPDSEPWRRLQREHAGAIMSRLIRKCRGDFGLADEALQEALAAAPAAWAEAGTPVQPRVWLEQTAQQKALDWLGRQSAIKTDDVCQLAAISSDSHDDLDTRNDGYLRLVFMCCHPALSMDAQLVLLLRSVCGLSSEEIAGAFAIEPATLARRLIRAKNKLRVAKVPYVVPDPAELARRLADVLAAVYQVFSEGYAATGGEVLLRSELCGEALRLGRLLVGLLPLESEAWALLALMLLHDSRSAARLSKSGELVLLAEQDRSLWDRAQIAEGLGCLDRALGLGGLSMYALQAVIAAHHARARSVDDTDWSQIALLYQRVVSRTQNAGAALNHAAAVAMAEGPERGLELLNGLAEDPSLVDYHLFYAARADLLRRLGQLDAAARDYTEALRLVGNEPERRYFARRLAELT